MSKTFIRFTETQRTQARLTNLAEFLSSRGEDIKRCGAEYQWNFGEEKITIKKNLWFNHYRQEGGDAIDFARRFYNLDYPSAVELLLGSGTGTVIPQERTERETKPFELPPRNKDMRRVYAYLLKERCIDRDIINHFAHEKLLFEDAEYHNCVFVGLDENGVPRHAHKRGSTSQGSFKGNVTGSNPLYSFSHKGVSDMLYIFEAPIDMLSFLSLYPKDWQNHGYVSLCSVSPIAAFRILEENSNIKKVAFCLDNDKAGNDASVRIALQIRKQFPECILHRLSPENKDWNDDLKIAYKNNLERKKEQCPTLDY